MAMVCPEPSPLMPPAKLIWSMPYALRICAGVRPLTADVAAGLALAVGESVSPAGDAMMLSSGLAAVDAAERRRRDSSDSNGEVRRGFMTPYQCRRQMTFFPRPVAS